MPRGYRWLWFGHGDDHPVATREAGSIFNPDQQDEGLKEQWPESFVRKAIITQTNLDLAMGARIGAAISFDREHSSVIRARVLRGDAELVLGDRALQIVLSHEPTWEDLADLRRSRGVRDYRAILREVEVAAREEVGSGRPLPEAIWRGYTKQLEQAASTRPSLTAKVSVGLVGAGSGVVAGLATGGALMIGEIVGLAVGTVADAVAEHLSKPAWLSMDQTVRRGVRRRRPSQLHA